MIFRRHIAENIQIKVEEILNSYDFNKSKINAIQTDQGSNYLRLFKTQEQIELCKLNLSKKKKNINILVTNFQ